MEQLSALDSAFVYLESPRTPMHIGGVYLIDRAGAGSGFGYESLLRHVESRLQAVATFRQRLVEVPLALGHPFWVQDPAFDLASHISRHVLSPPGGKRELMALAATLFAQRLDRARPLWQLAFVEGLDGYPGLARGSIAVIGRVHHAAVDGVSGAEIMGALLDPAGAPERELPADRWRPERLPSGLELAARSYGALGAKSLDLARSLGATAHGLKDLLSPGGAPLSELPALPLQAPPTPLNRPVTARRVFGGVDFDLERLRPVRRTVPGATVNDVVLAICAGALRQWLAGQDALPVSPLVAMVPISVRGEKERGSLGNQVSAMLVELATDLEDPHLRLATILRATRGAKVRGRALPAPRLMGLVPSATAALASRLYTRMKLAARHRPLFNLVITNVPGPALPLQLAGARVQGHLGTAPVFDGLGMMLVVFSLAGRMSIGITACAAVLPDVEAFEDLLEDSLAALEAEPAIQPAVLASVASRPPARHPEVAALRAASDRLALAIERLGIPDDLE